VARCLLVVEDRFEIAGRGVAVIPGVTPSANEVLRCGQRLVLRRPDGSSLESEIGALELMTPNPRNEVTILIRNCSKTHVPLGTEVWSTCVESVDCGKSRMRPVTRQENGDIKWEQFNDTGT
jgi:hypothetical protein